MNHFKPVICKKCGAVVWSGISWAGFPKMLDTDRLTIEEEIIKRINGLMTYEAHRTQVTFEVVERSLQRIKWAQPNKDRVILADHRCSDFKLFQSLETVPDYWSGPVKEKVEVEGFPF